MGTPGSLEEMIANALEEHEDAFAEGHFDMMPIFKKHVLAYVKSNILVMLLKSPGHEDVLKQLAERIEKGRKAA